MKSFLALLTAVLMGMVVTFSTPTRALFQDRPGEGEFWPSNDLGETLIPICFHDRFTTIVPPQPPEGTSVYPVYALDDWQEKRALVVDTLRDTWEKWSLIRFDDRGTCSADQQDWAGFMRIHLIRDDCGGCGDVVPRGYHPEGVRVWLKMDNADTRLLRTVVIHEIGHALGFRHEMDRPDAHFDIPSEPLSGHCGTAENPTPATPCCRVEEPLGQTLSAHYDDVSIMNYCAPRNRNGLSSGDIEGLEESYGGSQHLDWLKASPILNLYAM